MSQAGSSKLTALLGRCRVWVTLALVLYFVMMFTATHIPTVPSQLAEVSDKLMHFLVYAGLGFLLCLYRATRQPASWKDAGIVLGIGSIYAVLDELLQIPVGRHCDAMDWLADTIGILIGIAAFGVLWFIGQGRRGVPPRSP